MQNRKNLLRDRNGRPTNSSSLIQLQEIHLNSVNELVEAQSTARDKETDLHSMLDRLASVLPFSRNIA